MSKVLIVDDDLEFCESVSRYLQIKGNYECDIALNQIQLFEKIKKTRYDLITLDVQLDEENGIQVLPQIKKVFSGPVVLISCLGDKENKINGLRSGALDYMVKPIVLEELYIRSQRLITQSADVYVTKIEDYYIDEANEIAYQGDKKLKLAPHAFWVLALLLKNKGTVISRERISTMVWNYEQCESRVVDVTISKLRSITGDSRIKTVRGLGYMYEDTE